MIVSQNLDSGLFYTMDCGYLLPLQDLTQGQELRFEPMAANSSMLEMEKVLIGDQVVGMNFKSGFQTVNKHTYILVASAQAQKAENYSVLFRSEDVAVYNFPNRGCLAISTKLSPMVRTFVKEQ
ncbi:hypothetical protein [Achromobacter phage Motura]|uniref:Uncharacterized protein n=1 Tax=Achromobacter phage Motura TaxID=2591403 RepID=A0A514CSF7_9CAUD|nr:hypothetical protein H1O15_gp002 [Achromobacter phage Motura]QDH83411.1 hypothetical protein [Achromobacter phage Motura]